MNIDENKPHDDEDLGGFDAHDDDSFALEHLESYPGDLSKFQDTATPQEDSGTNEEFSDTSETSRQYSVSAPGQQQNPREDDLEPLQAIGTYRPALGEGHDNPTVPFERSGSLSDDIDAGQYSSSRSTLEPKDSPDDSSKQVAEVFEKIDDEWVLLLKQDVERSKERKANAPKQTELPQPELPKSNKNFTPVEDSDSTDQINLADIEALHPSTYKLEDDNEPQQTPQPSLEQYTEESPYSSYATMAAEMAANAPEPTPIDPVIPPTPPPSIPKQVKPRDEKKRKRMLVLAFGTVVLAAAGYGAYRYYPDITGLFEEKSPAPIVSHDSVVPLTIAKAEVHDSVHAEAHDSVKTDIPIAADTVAVHEEPHEIAKPEPVKHEEIKPVLHEEPKEKVQPVLKPSKKIEKIAEIPKEKQAPIEQPVIKRKAPSKMLAHNNASASTSHNQTVQPVFMVQVYSSPSKDDATERLERLRSRNAANISMSEQLIRGKTWYRVRFGSFASRDEAEAAAKQFGLAQCWIDRVR